MLLRNTLAWFILLAVAIVNASIREGVYRNALGELRAHQVSTFTAILFFGVVIWWLSRLWPPASARQAWQVGGIWLALTVAFEFLFGHFAMGHAWSKLFHDYNLFEGRVWLLLLAWITVAPWLFYRTRISE